MPRRRFDRRYYARYYEDPRTRVSEQAGVRRLARFVGHYLLHIGQPVRSVLDIGCGLGLWQPALREIFPRLRYTGVEYSEYLCECYGWERGSVVDYRAAKPFDLVICQGVLQYLDDRSARAAITNLGELTGGAVYVEALTRGDWQQNVDRERTDGNVHLRPAAWYRRELARQFVPIGGGLHLARSSPATLYELEQPG